MHGMIDNVVYVLFEYTISFSPFHLYGFSKAWIGKFNSPWEIIIPLKKSFEKFKPEYIFKIVILFYLGNIFCKTNEKNIEMGKRWRYFKTKGSGIFIIID